MATQIHFCQDAATRVEAGNTFAFIIILHHDSVYFTDNIQTVV